MAQMLIRNLEEGVVEGLRRRAAENRTSVEEEARRALAASTNVDHEAWLQRVRRLRQATGPLSGPSSLDILRADRSRDDLP